MPSNCSLSVCPVCNGWMYQDETWYGSRSWTWSYCVRWEPSSPPPNGHSPIPIFSPCLLWPNGWIDQDATWYGGRPQPWRQYVRWEPSSSSKKSTAAPTFRPRPIVVKRLDGSRCHKGRPWPRPHCVRWGPISPKVAQPPNFWPMSTVAKRSPNSATAEHLLPRELC